MHNNMIKFGILICTYFNYHVFNSTHTHTHTHTHIGIQFQYPIFIDLKKLS
jgi:hypothetical protein